MATFTKVNDFVEHLALGYHGDLSSVQLAVALSNTAPGSETPDPTTDGNGILVNVTEIAYTNLSTRNITTTSCSQAAGVLSLVLVDLVLTASGTVPTFRYAYIYNTASTTVANALIGVYDRGSTIDMASGETTTLDFTDAQTLIDIT